MHTSLRAKAIAGLELVLPAFVLDRLAEKQVFKKDHLWPACPAFDYILAALQMYRMHGIQWRLPYNLHASFLPADGRARHCQKCIFLGCGSLPESFVDTKLLLRCDWSRSQGCCECGDSSPCGTRKWSKMYENVVCNLESLCPSQCWSSTPSYNWPQSLMRLHDISPQSSPI